MHYIKYSLDRPACWDEVKFKNYLNAVLNTSDLFFFKNNIKFFFGSFFQNEEQFIVFTNIVNHIIRFSDKLDKNTFKTLLMKSLIEAGFFG